MIKLYRRLLHYILKHIWLWKALSLNQRCPGQRSSQINTYPNTQKSDGCLAHFVDLTLGVHLQGSKLVLHTKITEYVVPANITLNS